MSSNNLVQYRISKEVLMQKRISKGSRQRRKCHFASTPKTRHGIAFQPGRHCRHATEAIGEEASRQPANASYLCTSSLLLCHLLLNPKLFSLPHSISISLIWLTPALPLNISNRQRLHLRVLHCAFADWSLNWLKSSLNILLIPLLSKHLHHSLRLA